ncbi:MAG TPA: hypothetical protein VJ809_17370 [Pirellulales bacterium]|nr:hypothetical protein [Pirellulales bacterium]
MQRDVHGAVHRMAVDPMKHLGATFARSFVWKLGAIAAVALAAWLFK